MIGEPHGVIAGLSSGTLSANAPGKFDEHFLKRCICDAPVQDLEGRVLLGLLHGRKHLCTPSQGIGTA